MYRNKLLFVYLCRTFVSNKKKNYEKMRLEDTRNMLVLYSSRCWGRRQGRSIPQIWDCPVA